jgi:hypothetical protein
MVFLKMTFKLDGEVLFFLIPCVNSLNTIYGVLFEVVLKGGYNNPFRAGDVLQKNPEHKEN